MPNPIPKDRREQVYQRDKRCVRCGAAGSDWHHRRRRTVRDAHTHCSCNGVFLCRTCHRWVHLYPLLARQSGLAVSRYERMPGAVPVHLLTGSWLLGCAGDASPG